ncbi:hypothetical protein VZT92_017737 [Zoarces viviparus]|uniref:Uncharacterized protein n=1 Tax=Zoarces viviparus TaxID=48416 RepID=A0AAW1ENY2_ZOAVI
MHFSPLRVWLQFDRSDSPPPSLDRAVFSSCRVLSWLEWEKAGLPRDLLAPCCKLPPPSCIGKAAGSAYLGSAGWQSGTVPACRPPRGSSTNAAAATPAEARQTGWWFGLAGSRGHENSNPETSTVAAGQEGRESN